MGDTLHFEDVAEGDAGPERRHTLTRGDLVRYAGASGDFNPMHTDEVAAKESGLPSVFGHGMYTAGLLGTALTDWVGIGNLRRYQMRFTKQTWPGEELVARLTVVAKRVEGDEHLVDLRGEVANADGEVKLSAEATAALPSRSG